jgi:two-component system C4-dicarboxylate transport sensor histidine kinase DctB
MRRSLANIGRVLSARSIRLAAIGLVIVVATGLLVRETVRRAEQSEIGGIANQLRIKLDGFADHLQSELKWFDSPPTVLAESHELTELLDSPGAPDRRDAANAFLRHFNHGVSGAASYLMNADGLTLAASNFNEPVSFVGHNYRFRPYFKAAIAGRIGHYVASGVTSNALGYYVAAPIKNGGKVRGVAVVKYAPTNLVSVWHDAANPIAIADENGVIFASTDARFRLHTLQTLAPSIRAAIAEQKQYPPEAPLTPLPLLRESTVGSATVSNLRLREIEAPTGNAGEAPSKDISYVVEQRQLPRTDWHIVALGALDKTPDATVPIVIGGVFAGSLAFLLVLFFEQRRASRRALALNEARLRTILEASPIGTSVTTLDGHKLFSSARYSELFGYSRDEIAKIDAHSLHADPRRRAALLEQLRRDGSVRDQEVEFRRPDGSRWWGLISWSRITYENQTAYVSWCYEITQLKNAEQEIRQARDAAEANLRELRAAQASLIQAEKMASLGQLTAGIAHEIKNPLNFINNFSALAIDLIGELDF